MSSFRYSSAYHPCAICGGRNGNCRHADDLYFCYYRRGEDVDGFNFLRTSGPVGGDIWGLYLVDAALGPAPFHTEEPAAPKRSQQEKKKPKRPATLDELPRSLLHYVAEESRPLAVGDDPAQKLSAMLGLPEWVFLKLRVGFLANDTYGRSCFVSEEKNESGSVIGYAFRYLDNAKRSHGARGLCYATQWDLDQAGPILLPEGASDVLSCLAIGLSAIGRPSNTGGVDLLAPLLNAALEDHAERWVEAGNDGPAPVREIIVLGENDQKPDGTWPGRDGAQHTAQRLALLLNRPVRVAFPPAGAKDVRAWLCAAIPNLPSHLEWSSDLAAAGRAFAAALLDSPDCSGQLISPPGSDGATLMTPERPGRFYDAALQRQLAADRQQQDELEARLRYLKYDVVDLRCLRPKKFFQPAKNQRHSRICEHRCKTCVHCIRMRKERWKENFRSRVKHSHGRFFAFECDTWEYQRNGSRWFAGNFARVARLPEAGLIVVGCVIAGLPVDRFPEGTKEITADEAVEILCQAIDRHHGYGAFVWAGKRWALPPERRAQTNLWEEGKHLPQDLEDGTIQEIIEANGVTVDPERGFGGGLRTRNPPAAASGPPGQPTGEGTEATEATAATATEPATAVGCNRRLGAAPSGYFQRILYFRHPVTWGARQVRGLYRQLMLQEADPAMCQARVYEEEGYEDGSNEQSGDQSNSVGGNVGSWFAHVFRNCRQPRHQQN